MREFTLEESIHRLLIVVGFLAAILAYFLLVDSAAKIVLNTTTAAHEIAAQNWIADSNPNPELELKTERSNMLPGFEAGF